jgi:hypothetical protein
MKTGNNINNKRVIGFSHGVTWKIHDPFTKENIESFINCGCNALEIHYHSHEDIEKLEIIEPYIQKFIYKSIHLPCGIVYKEDQITNNVLSKIVHDYKRIGARLAVVHPDLVEDWSVFEKYPSVHWAIENMDDRKGHYKQLGDLKDFFNQHDTWSFVLDLGHCNSNDKTMQLANYFISELGHKIKEIHLSGYIIFHEPLFRTKQIEILSHCNNLNVPIIIESTFELSDSKSSVAKELKYILDNLN